MPQTKLGLCFYVETGELALKFVKEVFVRENDTLLRIETGSGDVDATTSHPFYVVGRGWVAAGDLSVGDAIRALSGDVRTVTALRLEKLESPIPVYNLDVEDFDTYFVTGSVLVHNECRKMRSKVENKANDIPEIFKGFRPTMDHKTPTDAAKDAIKSIDDIINPRKGPGSDFNKLLKYFSRHFIWD